MWPVMRRKAEAMERVEVPKVIAGSGRMSRLTGTLWVAGLIVMAFHHSPEVRAAGDDEYPFGRLFTGSEQRQALDRLKRDQGLMPEAVVPAAGQPSGITSIDEVARAVRFSGYLRRADGENVVWIDGAADLSGSATSDAEGERLGIDNTMGFSQAENQVRLRAGQTWKIEENSISEVYRATDPLLIGDPVVTKVAAEQTIIPPVSAQ